MPPIKRPAVEKWTRSDLEDKFYELSQQNLTLKKQNNCLTKDLKILNGRRVTNSMASGDSVARDAVERNVENLRQENRLLEQKLKVLKHQLLSYSKPVLSVQTKFTKKGTRPSTALRMADVQETHKTNRNEDSPTLNTKKFSGTENDQSHSLIIENVNVSDKTNLIRLQRANHDMEVELEELRISENKAKQKLSTLRAEYDHVAQELKVAQEKLNENNLKESANIRNDVLKSNECTHNNATIAEKEIDILNEEKRVLKAAQDRLIAKSLEEESNHNAKLQEFGRLSSYVEQLKKSLADEKHLRKALEEEILRYQSLVNSDNNATNTDSSKPVKQQLPEKAYQSPETRTILQRKIRSQKGDWGSPVLDRLFQDVIGIIDSHVTANNNYGTDGILNMIDKEDTKTTSRWQKMYEQIYLELEKVRQMLLSQYSINQSIKQEMADMSADLDIARRNFDGKCAEYIAEIKDKSKQIDLLENQLRSIASYDRDLIPNRISSPAASEFRDCTEAKSTKDGGLLEMILRFSKLVISEDGIKLTDSVRPVLFLSIEFFDFELQTTPLLNGPEATFDYSMSYDILVSNLFIHYIQTDGISVELFQVVGTSYCLISNGIISLRKLLAVRPLKHLNGRLEFYSPPSKSHKSSLIGYVDYHIEVPINLMKALNTQRRKMLATTYLHGEPQDNTLHNELYVDIHRCVSLDKLLLSTGQHNPSTYVAYQLFDLPVHMTKTVKDNINPVYNDSRAWTLPLGKALHDYLKSQDLQIFVVEDMESNIPIGFDSKCDALGSVRIPLFPTAKNQRICGTFPLIRSDESISEASIDISIRWKYAYIYEEDEFGNSNVALSENMETTKLKSEQTTSKSPALSQQRNNTMEKQIVKESPDGNIQDISEVKERDETEKLPENQIEHLTSVSAKSRLQEVLKEPLDSSSDESQMDIHELENRLLHIRTPVLTPDTATDNKHSTQPLPKLRNIPKPIEEVSSTTKMIGSTSEHTSVLPSVHAKETDSNSSDSSVPSDATYTTSGTQSVVVENHIEPLKLNIAPRAVEIEFKSEVQADETLKNVEQEMERMLQLGAELSQSQSSSASLSPTNTEQVTVQMSKMAFEGETPQPPVRRSLLGDLPSLQPPTVPTRKTGSKAVEFTDPLHSSIPPSEASSLADEHTTNESSSSETPRQRPIAKRRVTDLPLNDANRAPSSLRTPNPQELLGSPEIEEQSHDIRVSIYIGRLRLLEGSPLLSSQYDGAQVFVEWNFLDFNRDICETPGTFALPRKSTDICNFDSERLYELNRRRTDLLAQWTHLNNRLTFTLVMDPMDDESRDFDDLCIGELNLKDAIETSEHFITMRSVDNMPMALIEVNMNYSERLLERIQEE